MNTANTVITAGPGARRHRSARRTLRLLTGTAVSAALLLAAGCAADDGAGPPEADQEEPDVTESGSSADQGPSASPSSPSSPTSQEPQGPSSSSSGMELTDTITYPTISPKSVAANGDGLVIANNMLYQHTVTLYDAESRQMLQNLSDTLDFADFGLQGYPDEVRGAPVEAVWTEDGEYAYVSQYMLDGVGASADDDCSNEDDIAPSVVYRYSVADQDWDQVIEVGRVPKFVEITPDGSTLLVSNWCDSSLSVVDLESGEETEVVELNTAPRGIAVMPDNTTAYVTAMYADELYRVDLDSGEAELVYDDALYPRHLVLSPDASELYVTFADSDALMAFDTATDEVVREAETGEDPRSMEISPDGTALYVVNYGEATVSKFDAETFQELDREPTGELPIGVTYEPVTDTVWVANYSGTISVFDDHPDADADADASPGPDPDGQDGSSAG